MVLKLLDWDPTHWGSLIALNRLSFLSLEDQVLQCWKSLLEVNEGELAPELSCRTRHWVSARMRRRHRVNEWEELDFLIDRGVLTCQSLCQVALQHRCLDEMEEFRARYLHSLPESIVLEMDWHLDHKWLRLMDGLSCDQLDQSPWLKSQLAHWTLDFKYPNLVRYKLTRATRKLFDQNQAIVEMEDEDEDDEEENPSPHPKGEEQRRLHFLSRLALDLFTRGDLELLDQLYLNQQPWPEAFWSDFSGTLIQNHGHNDSFPGPIFTKRFMTQVLEGDEGFNPLTHFLVDHMKEHLELRLNLKWNFLNFMVNTEWEMTPHHQSSAFLDRQRDDLLCQFWKFHLKDDSLVALNSNEPSKIMLLLRKVSGHFDETEWPVHFCLRYPRFFKSFRKFIQLLTDHHLIRHGRHVSWLSPGKVDWWTDPLATTPTKMIPDLQKAWPFLRGIEHPLSIFRSSSSNPLLIKSIKVLLLADQVELALRLVRHLDLEHLSHTPKHLFRLFSWCFLHNSMMDWFLSCQKNFSLGDPNHWPPQMSPHFVHDWNHLSVPAYSCALCKTVRDSTNCLSSPNSIQQRALLIRRLMEENSPWLPVCPRVLYRYFGSSWCRWPLIQILGVMTDRILPFFSAETHVMLTRQIWAEMICKVPHHSEDLLILWRLLRLLLSTPLLPYFRDLVIQDNISDNGYQITSKILGLGCPLLTQEFCREPLCRQRVLETHVSHHLGYLAGFRFSCSPFRWLSVCSSSKETPDRSREDALFQLITLSST